LDQRREWQSHSPLEDQGHRKFAEREMGKLSRRVKVSFKRPRHSQKRQGFGKLDLFLALLFLHLSSSHYLRNIEWLKVAAAAHNIHDATSLKQLFGALLITRPRLVGEFPTTPNWDKTGTVTFFSRQTLLRPSTISRYSRYSNLPASSANCKTRTRESGASTS
jgi:hypothetical protein